MPKGRWPRGVTPRPMSGAAVGRSYPTSEVRGSSREELISVLGQGRRRRLPGCDSAGAAERSYPPPEAGAATERSNPTSKERWLCGRRRA